MSENPADLTGAAPSAAPSAPSSTPASATATPSTPSSSAQPSAPATHSAAPSTQNASYEPPRERWADILDNARRKTRAEAEAESRSRYAKYDAFEQDPWGAMQQWLSAAAQHSLYGPLVKQWAHQQQEPTEQPEPEADVPIVDESGRVTGQTYSATRLKAWQHWNESRQQQAWDARFGPIEQRTNAFAEAVQQAHTQQQSDQWAQSTLGPLRAMPYFKDHEPAIRHALEDHEEWGDNIHAAYNHVLLTQILPQLSSAEAKQVLDSLNNKATGGTVSPGSHAAGQPQFKSFKDAVTYYDAHPDEAQAMAARR